jgi:hypothetical protein
MGRPRLEVREQLEGDPSTKKAYAGRSSERAPQPIEATPEGLHLMVIRRLDVLSVAKIFGVMGFVFAGLILLLLVVVPGQVLGGQPDHLAFLACLGMCMIVFYPLFLGVMYFVMGAILAALYNFAAGMVGGILIEIERPIRWE